MLEIKNLYVRVDKKNILSGVSHIFEKGKVYALMGPNGSGKSTVAFSIMGHPQYDLNCKSQIYLDKKNITDLPAEKRARLGLFMSFQTPPAITGVNILQLLRYGADKKIEILELKNRLERYAKKLQIRDSLLKRSLNEGFSGGERKKMEILQALILKPKVLIFDEIDTGVDVDALKLIGRAISELRNKNRIIILITHHKRILQEVKPDEILILKNGKIVQKGDFHLADRIEKKGYGKIVYKS